MFKQRVPDQAAGVSNGSGAGRTGRVALVGLADALHGLTTGLARAGFSLVHVDTLAEVRARCADLHLDAVLLDDTAGAHAEQVRTLAVAEGDTPVILLSSDAERTRALSAVVTATLIKPVSAATVVSLLRQAGVDAHPEIRVLLVDEDEQTARLATQLLTAHGFSVEPYRSPTAALAAVSARRPGAVVLDLVMAEMDGFAFLEALRRTPHNHATPVVVWTAKALTAADRERLGRFTPVVIEKGPETVRLVEEVSELLSPRDADGDTRPGRRPTDDPDAASHS